MGRPEGGAGSSDAPLREIQTGMQDPPLRSHGNGTLTWSEGGIAQSYTGVRAGAGVPRQPRQTQSAPSQGPRG